MYRLRRRAHDVFHGSALTPLAIKNMIHFLIDYKKFESLIRDFSKCVILNRNPIIESRIVPALVELQTTKTLENEH